jgi:hypothetical protein
MILADFDNLGQNPGNHIKKLPENPQVVYKD